MHECSDRAGRVPSCVLFHVCLQGAMRLQGMSIDSVQVLFISRRLLSGHVPFQPDIRVTPLLLFGSLKVGFHSRPGLQLIPETVYCDTGK